MTGPGTEFVTGHPSEMRGAATIYVDTGSDTGHRDTILSAIAEALPALTVVPLFAADLALFYRGTPSAPPGDPGEVAEPAGSDPPVPVGFGMVSRPDRDWRSARVLLTVDGTAAAFAAAVIAAYGGAGPVPSPTEKPLVC